METKKLLFVFASMMFFSHFMMAQTCGEKLQKAKEYQEKGLKSKDINLLEKAVYQYRLVSQCDPDVSARCEREIKSINKVIKSYNPDLTISAAEISIPYQGGGRQVDVVSNGKWVIESEGDAFWCKTEKFENNSFAVNCFQENDETRERTLTLKIRSGSIYKSLKVTQEARPEYIDVGAKSLSTPSQGAEDNISVKSNANWYVSTAPTWCTVEEKDSFIHIIVSPNDRVMERTDDIVISTPSQNITIKLYQGAGEEHLTLSQNDLYTSSKGGKHYLKVYTDADNWFVGDYPTWMHVSRVGRDSLCVVCDPNIPNTGERYGGLQVRTDRQQVDVRVRQEAMAMKDIVMPYSSVVGGRNVSFGISASYYMPFVGSSAGGDYVGSVHDYGLGTSAENASYKSAVGYSIGIFTDIRLYRNIFLTAGVNFSQIKYKNEFNRNTIYTMPRSNYEYMRGELQNAYTEKYTHTMIEVPLLASYRFKINNISHVQFNLGPVLNFGLSAKMKFSGNSNCETMKIYNNITHQPVDNSNYLHHTAVDTEFNLYQPCVKWEEMYTTGNDAGAPHHDEFQQAPFRKLNCGLRFGVAYEWAGLSLGISYTHMLTNMAQKNYWDNERWTVLNNSDVTMKGYSHRLNTLEVRLAYTLRYINTKKSK